MSETGGTPSGAPRRPVPPDASGLDRAMARWDVVADGEPVLTRSSRLLPVRAAGAAAMLKISADPQERIGAEVARKLLEFSETGSTVGAVNFPQVQLPPRITSARYLHVHRNVPGMLGHLNDVFSRGRYNIASQYLQTDAELG